MVKTQSCKSTNDMTCRLALASHHQICDSAYPGLHPSADVSHHRCRHRGKMDRRGRSCRRRRIQLHHVSHHGLLQRLLCRFRHPYRPGFRCQGLRQDAAYVSNSIRIAVVFAVVITFLSWIFCEKILHLVNTPKEVFDYAYIFLMLQFAAIPFTIAYNLLSGQIRALGNSKQPFYFLITASVINIILDVDSDSRHGA